MISGQSRTKEWIMGVRDVSPRGDPILIEKMIMALILVEHLTRSGLNFIFKGGTSLALLLGRIQRFSIDIDIILPDDRSLEDCFQLVLNQGAFHRIEENKRAGDLPKQHYKFYFMSVIQQRESHILLDILFEKNPYPRLQDVEIVSDLISVEGESTKVVCPVLEGLLGDKLTAFAPHTTGIRFGVNKELEMAKQLFDIAVLFDVITDIEIVATAFNNIASQELAYRALNELTPEDILVDAFDTAVLMGLRGLPANHEYAELVEGSKKLAAFTYSGFFTLDSAILCASKAAYLSALILRQKNSANHFNQDLDLSTWSIANPDYNRLNKLKKTSPETFYYFYLAVDLMDLSGT